MAVNHPLDLVGTVRSLLNIEVNTILSENVTAEQMPPLPHAVLDIAGWYANALCEMGVELDAFLTAQGRALDGLPVTWGGQRAFVSGNLKFSPDTFDSLRWAAKAAADERGRGEKLTESQRILLARIVNNSDTIKEAFKHFDPKALEQFGGKTRAGLLAEDVDRASYTLTPDELVQLQKIWDLGVDEVVAQTIVFLNGAVTTRIQRAFNLSETALLFDIHRQSVDVSVGCWRYLLQVVEAIAGAAIGAIFQTRRQAP